MAEAKPDPSTCTVGEPEADADSIEVEHVRIGDYILSGPLSLSAEAGVREEVRRILITAGLTLDPNQHTFVVTSSEGDQVWLNHEEVIEDKLDDLTAPLHVEIVKFGEEPRGIPLNINDLNVVQK